MLYSSCHNMLRQDPDLQSTSSGNLAPNVLM